MEGGGGGGGGLDGWRWREGEEQERQRGEKVEETGSFKGGKENDNRDTLGFGIICLKNT